MRNNKQEEEKKKKAGFGQSDQREVSRSFPFLPSSCPPLPDGGRGGGLGYDDLQLLWVASVRDAISTFTGQKLVSVTMRRTNVGSFLDDGKKQQCAVL